MNLRRVEACVNTTIASEEGPTVHVARRRVAHRFQNEWITTRSLSGIQRLLLVGDLPFTAASFRAETRGPEVSALSQRSSVAPSGTFSSMAPMAILRSSCAEQANAQQAAGYITPNPYEVTMYSSSLREGLLVLFVILQVKGPLEREWHAATGRPARREHRVARGAIS